MHPVRAGQPFRIDGLYLVDIHQFDNRVVLLSYCFPVSNFYVQCTVGYCRIPARVTSARVTSYVSILPMTNDGLLSPCVKAQTYVTQ